MNKKLVKYAAYAVAGYFAYKALEKSGTLKGLGLADDIPYDINVPVQQYPYGYNPYGASYGYNPYQYSQPINPYAVSQPYNPYYGYSYPNGYSFPTGYNPVNGLMTPPAPGFSYNPYGGGTDPYGNYIPKVVTASGGFQGFRN